MIQFVKIGAATLTNIAADHGVMTILKIDAHDGIKMDAAVRRTQTHVTQNHGRTPTMLHHLVPQI